MLRLSERACNLSGEFEINASNPLARGLIFCAPGGRDVISGSVAVPLNQYSSTKSAKKTSRYGVGLQSRGVHDGGFVFRNVPNVQARVAGNDKITMAFLGESLTWTQTGVIFGIPADDTTWVRPWLCVGITRNSLDGPRMRFGYSYTTGGTPDFASGIETVGLITDQIRCYGVIKRAGASQQILCADRTTISNPASQAGTFWTQSSSVYLFSRNSGSATAEGVQNAACWLACLWDRDLSIDEWLSFQADPFQILRKKAQAFYFLPDLGLSLSVGSMALSVAAESVTLVQSNILGVFDSELALSIAALQLSGSEQLVVADASVATDLESPALSQNNVLNAFDVAVEASVDSILLAQAGVLSVDAVGVAVVVDALVLQQANVISVDDATAGVVVDGVVLTQASVLSVADASAALLMDSVALSTADSLSVESLGVATAAGSVQLVQASVLSLGDVSLGTSADSVVLALNSVIVVADSSLSISIESVVVGQSNLLVVSDVGVSVTAESPILIQRNALAINDASLSILMDSLTIGGGVFVTESALGMIIRDFQYVLLVEG